MRRGGRLPQPAGGKIPVLVIINRTLENTRTFGSKLKAVFSNVDRMDPHSTLILDPDLNIEYKTRIQIQEPKMFNFLEFYSIH